MTPEQFDQAQQLFLRAVATDPAEREAYVLRHAESDEVRDEVLSLLKYHRDDTLLPRQDASAFRSTLVAGRRLDATAIAHADETVPPHEQTAHEQTPTGGGRVAGAAVAPAEPDPSILRLQELESEVDVSERFAQSTHRLLQSRLIIATIVLSGMLVTVTLVALLFDEVNPTRLAVRAATLCLLGLCGGGLVKFPNLSRRWLRGIELLIVAIPLVELVLIQWSESTEDLVGNEAIQIEELRAIVFAAASIYIAVYGMFIPSNWRRTAAVTGCIAVLPLIVSFAHQAAYVYPPEVQRMHFVNPTLSFIMAVVATVGSGIVHQVRRAAESARYYGQYQLIRELGRGGMGVVYLGRHQMLKRPAAIKLIRTEAAGSSQAIAQFEREVQATATLSHWNTVQIYDYGITDEGDFYCVMEYLRGFTLGTRLHRSGPLPVGKTMELVMQLCDGLQEAHAKGMVHRDIKPANVFLAEIGGLSDVVKLLDFGLVTSADETDETGAHAVGGTPAYMSPEQIRGEALDGRSDIYAIGCVIYECLTGMPLFRAASVPQTFSQHLFQAPDLSAVATAGDPELVCLIEKCLAKDRRQRYSGVAELKADCRTIG